MRKSLIWLTVLLFTVSVAFMGISCKEKAPVEEETTAPATAEETTAEETTAEETTAEETAAKELNFYLSFHDPTIPWGQPMKQGVMDAAAEFGVHAEFIGPTPPDAVKQLEQIKTLVEQGKVDGLAVAPLDEETFRPFIDELIDKGIPVVTVTTDSPESKRLAFYGQTFEALEKTAYELTKKTIELLDEPKGKVAILNCLPDLESLIQRENGSKRAIAEYPDLELIGTFANKTDFAACYADVEALMTAHPDIVALFAEDSFTTPSAAKVLRDLGIKEKVKVSGYDITEECLLLVKDGYLDILVGQNPYMQGYLAIKALYEYVVKGIQPQTVDVEPEYVTQENIDEYLKMYNVTVEE